ncbi:MULTISPECIES: DUF2789 domain-containing protein [Pseudomonas]|jgi:hypothetical protein|uniref:DUF2789 domain-containing protein n=1 Tax=Serpens gallinarum TaxID=2763075 RepID=A0ABR8TJV0_9PSED|nr:MULTISPECIES: DUF2789 domain-containing protein [Pseudomonas]MBD7976036.1 DUF2789 domain-containing protein [Serpens gallinarum]MBF0675368.1 DUF2789 domain-containing protein [Pseudomonas sp.]
MELSVHPFHSLFEQLGLPNDNDSIRQFIEQHSPLPENVLLADAPFWTPAQAAFLREEILDDADWAVVVDNLNVALRKPDPSGAGY